MTDSGMSAADFAALTNSNEGMLSGGWLWFIIVLFAIFGNGFGFGGNQQYATSADVQRSTETINSNARFNSLFDNQSRNAMDNMALIDRNQIENSTLISNNKYDNAVLIKDAQYTNLQNTNALAASLNQNADAIVAGINANSNAIVMSQTNGFNSVNAGINDLGYQIQSTSCATNRNIDSVKYENAQNTCAITNAIHQEAEATRAMIQQNTIQDLRDRLEDKDRLYQAANFQISQNAQSAHLLDCLGRWVSNPPMPIYAVPYGYGTAYNTTIA